MALTLCFQLWRDVDFIRTLKVQVVTRYILYVVFYEPCKNDNPYIFITVQTNEQFTTA